MQSYLKLSIKTIDVSRVEYYMDLQARRPPGHHQQSSRYSTANKNKQFGGGKEGIGNMSIFSYTDNTYIKESMKQQLLWKKYRGFILPLTDYRNMILHIFTIFAVALPTAPSKSRFGGEATQSIGWRRLTFSEAREILDDFNSWNEREKFTGRLIPLHVFLLWIKHTLLRIERVVKTQSKF
jgi:hypothetical protein